MGKIEDLFMRVPKTATRIYTPADPCPCESGKSVANCRCLVSGIADARTPHVGIAGYRHPKCYARSLSDCSRGISKDHFFIPKQVLKQGTGPVFVTGHEWQREAVQKVGINTLAANVLCRAHNTRLHALDDQFSRFYLHIMSSAKYLASNLSHEYVFNGHDIERWMLKALCGWIAARSIHQSFKIPNRWLQLLFGTRSMPSNGGLFFRVTGLTSRPIPHEPPGVPKELVPFGFSFQPIATTRANSDVGAPAFVTEYTGCEVTFGGLRIALSMRGRRSLEAATGEPRAIWRPKEIRWYRTGNPVVLSLRLRWPHGGGVSIVGMKTQLRVT